MSEISVVARLKIHPGKLDEFKNVAATCIATVKEKDTDTLRYDWFINDAQTECMVLEKYANSEAVLQHVGNLGETMAALMACVDFTGDFYGNPTDQLIGALSGFDTKFYRPL